MVVKRKDTKDFVSPGQELKESRRLTVKDLIGGRVLSREEVVRQIPFLLFLFILMIFYIANQYQGAKVMKEMIKVESRLKELRTESLSITFEKMELSKQSEVKKLIMERNLPLKEAVRPPYKIEID